MKLLELEQGNSSVSSQPNLVYLAFIMSIISRNGFIISRVSLLTRTFSWTPVLDTKEWRTAKGLSANKNAEGILTDGPDYTFLDGRPTPLLHKQKLRMLRQQEYASKIVQLSSELNFAKDRHQNILEERENERQRIISSRLKAKGNSLKKK